MLKRVLWKRGTVVRGNIAIQQQQQQSVAGRRIKRCPRQARPVQMSQLGSVASDDNIPTALNCSALVAAHRTGTYRGAKTRPECDLALSITLFYRQLAIIPDNTYATAADVSALL